jgi:hypothetical protein
MRRRVTWLSIGLAAILSALLYVGNGSGSDIVWTYPQCVENRVDNCESTQPGAVHCNHIAIICIRTEPRLQTWVYSWLIESAISICGIALVSVIVVKLRK